MPRCLSCKTNRHPDDFRSLSRRKLICNTCRADVQQELDDVARHHLGIPASSCTVHHFGVIGERLDRLAGTTVQGWMRLRFFPQRATREALAVMSRSSRACQRGRTTCRYCARFPHKMPAVVISA